MITLITGAKGFVGKNLISFLPSEYFQLIPSSRDGYRNIDTFLESGNIDACGIDAIVHLAGKAHDLKNASVVEEYYQVNTDLTRRLYDAFLGSKASVFVYISSVKAVADLSDIPLDENTVTMPATVYGDSKLKAEQYLLNTEHHSDKRVYILRPCMIHGPGNKGNLNLLYRFVTKGIPYPLASFENHRSFLSVGNLCFVIKELIERSDIPSGVYHVADDQTLSTNRVVQLMGEVLKKEVRLWRLPEAWIRFLARIGDRFGLPLNSERLGKLTENYMVSNAKLKKVLQKELPLTAEEGLRITLQSFDAKQPSLG